jgi:hypothetical protein
MNTNVDQNIASPPDRECCTNAQWRENCRARLVEAGAQIKDFGGAVQVVSGAQMVVVSDLAWLTPYELGSLTAPRLTW